MIPAHGPFRQTLCYANNLAPSPRRAEHPLLPAGSGPRPAPLPSGQDGLSRQSILSW